MKNESITASNSHLHADAEMRKFSQPLVSKQETCCL